MSICAKPTAFNRMLSLARFFFISLAWHLARAVTPTLDMPYAAVMWQKEREHDWHKIMMQGRTENNKYPWKLPRTAQIFYLSYKEKLCTLPQLILYFNSFNPKLNMQILPTIQEENDWVLYDISLVRDWKRKLKLINLGSERVKTRNSALRNNILYILDKN